MKKFLLFVAGALGAALFACEPPTPKPVAKAAPSKIKVSKESKGTVLSTKTPRDFGAAWRAILETEDPSQA